MSFSADALLDALDALIGNSPRPTRYLVAYSGGLDSTVLLHALVNGGAQANLPLQAVHVDHGLHPASTRWAEHCRSTAASWGVECQVERVAVDTASGAGVEAAAREARYTALAGLVLPGDWVLSAHHREDQAETLLLNLLRGSGPAGLAGIASRRRFAAGTLARPLLSFSRQALHDYAVQQELRWIDDPSNEDLAFDRNFLRHEVLPTIESRWPGAAERLFRSSLLAGDAAALLRDLASIDAAGLGTRPDRLDLVALRGLPLARQRNVLRHAIRESGLATPSAAQLQRVLDEVVAARTDADPLLRWNGVEVRRYRDCLYLLAAAAGTAPQALTWSKQPRLDLGAANGFLLAEPDASVGLDPRLIEDGLQIRYRKGGEKIRPAGQAHTKSLKNLLQQEGVVPWMRDRIPLLYAGDELVAVADLWLADSAASHPGAAIRWQDRPPIH